MSGTENGQKTVRTCSQLDFQQARGHSGTEADD